MVRFYTRVPKAPIISIAYFYIINQHFLKVYFTYLFILSFLFACNGQPSGRLINTSNDSTRVTRYLDSTAWDTLFPHRYGMDKQPAEDFYSFKAFVNAARAFPGFLAEGNDTIRKRELAAFLAQVSQETSGGWADAPGGYFKWGLCFVEEKQDGTPFAYIDSTKKNYLPVRGHAYFGRGAKQLSWNYNYGQFSEAWYGSKDTLLRHPEWVASDPLLAFASAIWFWMEPQPPKPSCHAIMTGQWQPTQADIQKGRRAGFGATVNVINGGGECGKGETQARTANRYKYYRYFCHYFGVPPGENIECSNQLPFGQ